MANDRHVARLKKGVRAWNKLRHQNKLIPLDLTGADLTGADLHGANLSGASLCGADRKSVV